MLVMVKKGEGPSIDNEGDLSRIRSLAEQFVRDNPDRKPSIFYRDDGFVLTFDKAVYIGGLPYEELLRNGVVTDSKDIYQRFLGGLLGGEVVRYSDVCWKRVSVVINPAGLLTINGKEIENDFAQDLNKAIDKPQREEKLNLNLRRLADLCKLITDDIEGHRAYKYGIMRVGTYGRMTDSERRSFNEDFQRMIEEAWEEEKYIEKSILVASKIFYCLGGNSNEISRKDALKLKNPRWSNWAWEILSI